MGCKQHNLNFSKFKIQFALVKSSKFLKVQKKILSVMTSSSTGKNLAPNYRGGESEENLLILQTTTDFLSTEAEPTLPDGAACTTLPQSVKFQRIIFKYTVIFRKTEIQGTFQTVKLFQFNFNLDLTEVHNIISEYIRYYGFL